LDAIGKSEVNDGGQSKKSKKHESQECDNQAASGTERQF